MLFPFLFGDEKDKDAIINGIKEIPSATELNPLLVYLRLSTRCNSKCFMCNLWRQPRTMKEEILKKAILLIRNTSPVEVRITGGEPTIAPHIKDVLQELYSSGTRTSIITNGSNPDTLEELSTYLSSAFVSLDFPDVRHDIYRAQKGLFEKVMQSLDVLNKNKIETVLHVVVSRLNLNDLGKITEIAISKNIKFIKWIPIHGFPNLSIGHKEIVQAKREIEKEYKVTIVYPENLDGSLCYVKYFTLFVDVDGSVYPCQNTPYLKKGIGNINNLELNSTKLNGIKCDKYSACDPENILINQYVNKII